MAQAPAPATYFLLRRLIEAGGRPSALIVDFKPSILAGSPRYSIRHWQAVLSPRECLELARDGGNAGMMIEIVLGRLLPSYRDRLEVREALVSALKGETAPTFATNRLALRNWGKNLGAHLNSSREPFSGEVSPAIHKKLLSDGWKCHKVNALYVDRLLALAESRAIPVFWLVPPLSPALQDRRERSGADRDYVALIRSMQAKHPGVTVVDGRHSGYENAVFADHNHLNGRGAVALSHELARIVASPSGPSRWVELPRFRDWPLDVPAEDVDQSRIALEAEAALRR